jgi:hypothetical protein
MFRALLAYPQEALHKRHLYPILVQPTDITRTQYTKCRFEAPPEDEQEMLETCRYVSPFLQATQAFRKSRGIPLLRF